MMSYALLFLAAVDFAALIWGVRQWLKQPQNYALLLSLTILFPIAFDAFSNGVGRFLGEGEVLELLVRFRMTWFYFSMPFLIPIGVFMLNYAGVGWTRVKGVTLGAFLLGAGLGSYQIIAYWDMALYPSCVFDIVRYVLEVPASQACRPEDAGLGEFALSPIVPVSAIFLMLTSFTLIWKTRFAWYAALFTASNIASAISVQIPREGYMTYVSYPFDGLLGFLLILTSIELYKRRQD
jgi:hypothetical protein